MFISLLKFRDLVSAYLLLFRPGLHSHYHFLNRLQIANQRPVCVSSSRMHQTRRSHCFSNLPVLFTSPNLQIGTQTLSTAEPAALKPLIQYF